MKATHAVGQQMGDGAFGTGRSGTEFVLRTGTQPASADAAATGTVLARLSQVGNWTATSISTTFFVCACAPFGGIVWQVASAGATGTAGYWRIEDGAGTCLLQGSVGTTGAEVNLTTLSITVGQSVTITFFQFGVSGLF